MAKLENDAGNELHSIMGLLELIAEGPLTPSQARHLRACRSSADRLLRTIQSVSMLAGQEPKEGQISEFDLQEIVSRVVGLTREIAARKGLSLACRMARSVPRQVSGDREGLEDVLFRLLDNAVKYTGQGQAEVLVSAVRANDKVWVQFDIRDTGPGIPPAVTEGLTDDVSGRAAGPGFGLPIVRQRIAAMGGLLSIGSAEQGGTRVTVTLPLIEKICPSSVEDAETEEREVVAKADRPLKILVAEDSDDSYYVLEAFLGEQHRLTRAMDGGEAVELFINGHYDLVFMDVHMPGSDGYSATHAIREWESSGANARIPIVVLSTDSPKTQRHLGAKAGCSAYLTKPVSKAAVLEVVNRYQSVL